ncbi:MAG: hypothetical protein ACOCZ5_00180 [bacterium]
MSLDFTIEGRMKSMTDVQRNWMWQLVFVPNGSIINDVLDRLRKDVFDELITDDALTLRCRSVSIPQRSTETITSDWMGTTQYTQGRPRFGNTLSVEFEETEDQVITEFLYDWQQMIFDIEPGLVGGSSQMINLVGSRRRSLSSTLYLEMFKYDGTKMKKRIKFINAWPQSVGDVLLSYGSNESVKYDVTFQFDFWKLVSIENNRNIFQQNRDVILGRD